MTLVLNTVNNLLNEKTVVFSYQVENNNYNNGEGQACSEKECNQRETPTNS